MKRRPIEQLVYEQMIPKPRPSDPRNFRGLLTQYLVYEVRQEVHSFFGHLDTQEARYPGLDYCHRIHRIRLCRWPWHRRLFRAFDALGLTPSEIYSLTKWEGTKWAKDRYEKEHGVTIPDTSGDGLPDWRIPGSRRRAKVSPQNDSQTAAEEPKAYELDDCFSELPSNEASANSVYRITSETDGVDETGHDASRVREADGQTDLDPGEISQTNIRTMPEREYDDDDSDTEIYSIGLQLHERLLERVAAHNAGDTSQPIDEDWEQWLKNALEAGDLPMASDNIASLTSALVAGAATTETSTFANSRDALPSQAPSSVSEHSWEATTYFPQSSIRQSLQSASSHYPHQPLPQASEAAASYSAAAALHPTSVSESIYPHLTAATAMAEMATRSTSSFSENDAYPRMGMPLVSGWLQPVSSDLSPISTEYPNADDVML